MKPQKNSQRFKTYSAPTVGNKVRDKFLLSESQQVNIVLFHLNETKIFI